MQQPERTSVSEQREGEQPERSPRAEEHGPAADAVGQPAGGDLHQCVGDQRTRDEEGDVE
ncbi:MAG TPA: hypothetical protein VIO13_05740 [Candidatus Dormibacteraeota bacterium]|jgi:hypothetical protein